MKKASTILITVLLSFVCNAQYNEGALDFDYPTANFTNDYSGTDIDNNGYLDYEEITLDPNAPSGPNFHLFDELSNGKPILIDFYTPSCGWCRTWAPIIEDVYETHGPDGDNTINVVGVCGYNGAYYPGYGGLYYFWESVANSDYHPLMTEFPTNPQVSDVTGGAGVFGVEPYNLVYWPAYIMVCPDRTWKLVDGWEAESEGQSYMGGPEALSDSIMSVANGCDPIATETNDALIHSFVSPVGQSCFPNVTPVVRLKSRGTTVLNSVDIIINVNGTDVSTYNWTGSINQYDMVEVTLNEVTLDPGENTVIFRVENPNGVVDENQANDAFTHIMNVIENSAVVNVTFDFDYVSNDDFSWRIEDQETNEILFEIAYDNSYAYGSDEQTLCLENDKCYNFIFRSNAGYGINASPTSESLILTHEGVELVHLDENNAEGSSGSTFTVTEEFCLGNPSKINAFQNIQASIYPNPGTGIVNVNVGSINEMIDIAVLDVVGNVVLKKEDLDSRSIQLNLSHLENGIYHVVLTTTKGEKALKYIKF